MAQLQEYIGNKMLVSGFLHEIDHALQHTYDAINTIMLNWGKVQNKTDEKIQECHKLIS
jgi:hypothetical protein